MTTHSKEAIKSAQTPATEQVLLTSTIVIPKEITTAEIHQKIEEYRLTLRFAGNPTITKPGTAYQLIILGLKSLGLLEET
jgi:hypothetical protein